MSLINRRVYTQSTTNHIYPEPRSLLRWRHGENGGDLYLGIAETWPKFVAIAEEDGGDCQLPRRAPAKRLTNRDAMRSWRFFKTVAAIRRAYYDEERILRHRHRRKNPALLLRSRYERQRINTRPIYSPSFHTRLMRLPSMTLTSHKTSGCRVIF